MSGEPDDDATWDTLTLEQKFAELGFPSKAKPDLFIEASLPAAQSERLHELLNAMAGASSLIAEVEEKTDGVDDCDTCKTVHELIVNDDDAQK